MGNLTPAEKVKRKAKRDKLERHKIRDRSNKNDAARAVRGAAKHGKDIMARADDNLYFTTAKAATQMGYEKAYLQEEERLGRKQGRAAAKVTEKYAKTKRGQKHALYKTVANRGRTEGSLGTTTSAELERKRMIRKKRAKAKKKASKK